MIVPASLAQLGFGQALRPAHGVNQRDVPNRNLALVGVADIDVDESVGDAVEASGDTLAVAQERGDRLVCDSEGGEAEGSRQRRADGDAPRGREAPEDS